MVVDQLDADRMSSALVLTVNGGSSSVKLRVLGSEDEILESVDARVGADGETDRVVTIIEDLGAVDIVAHRVVHGGERFTAATIVDPSVIVQLEQLVPLAPLHQRAALALIRAVGAARPHTPAVACFDTAFHSTLPLSARTYAIPEEWRTTWGIRRYGFHGLSHDYASGRACEIVGAERDSSRVVVCHLGSGASVCAVLHGSSVDTSMGFTPLEGLVMGTRSGTVDPGAVLWLIEQGGFGPATVRDALEHRSGLQALAGTSDMRAVTERAATGDASAKAALDIYIHRLRAEIAAMAAAMDGVDLLVFTGGVGENSSIVRDLACSGLSHLGIALDDRANEAVTTDAEISHSGSPVRCVVVTAREDLAMARAARAAITARVSPAAP
jgi:acetate kinase